MSCEEPKVATEQAGDGSEESEQPKKDLADTVAKHYNCLPETGLAQRTQSRIFYLRNFNNWTKSMAIGETLNKIREARGQDAELTVLDLCAGKGGDLQKWRKGRISRLILADIAETSVQQAEERYKDMIARTARDRRPSKIFDAEFYAADCTKVRLKDLYKSPPPQFDLVSCQFSFHYSLESLEQTEMMMRNACECLQPGGYFIGTTPDSYELVKRLRSAEGMSFGNDVYRVTFKTDDKENLPLFGAKYDFHLEGVVDCPEFLVYFPLLEKIAAKFDMKLVYRQPFADFYKKYITIGEGRDLIGRMQALEGYPASDNVELAGKEPEDYTAVKEAVEKLKEAQEKQNKQEEEEETRDRRRPRPVKVGTLSQAEWEAVTIYMAFAFQKVAPPAENEDLPAEGATADEEDAQAQKRSYDDTTDDGGTPAKVQKT